MDPRESSLNGASGTPAALRDKYVRGGQWEDRSLIEDWNVRVAAAPDDVLIVDEDTVLTNQVAWAAARRMALRLRQDGLAAGDRVVVQLPNWHEFAVAYLAVAQVGGVLVPMMAVYGEHEISHAATVSRATTYITCQEFRGTDYLARARRLRDRCPDLTRLIILRGDPAEDNDVLHYRDLVADGPTPLDEEIGTAPGPDDLHLVAFTSGTEAAAKGCLHTWNSYSSASKGHREVTRFGRESRELVPSPITHSTGLAVGLLKPLLSEGAAVFMAQWNPQRAIELIEQHRCTHLTIAPVFLTGILAEYDPQKHDLSSLRMCVCAGAPVPKALLEESRRRLPGMDVLVGYGQTEGMFLSITSADDAVVPGSVGRAVDGVELRIVDSSGEQLPDGDTGEIWYRSPGAMLGYCDNDTATAAVVKTDGWRSSGDTGHLQDGQLVITGRVKEIIIRAGSKISPLEIETLLATHSQVAQAAVIGVVDEALGERIRAVVVAADAASPPSLDSLRDYLRHDKGLAPHKLPDSIQLVTALPVTATGKLQRTKLRAQLDEADKVTTPEPVIDWTALAERLLQQFSAKSPDTVDRVRVEDADFYTGTKRFTDESLRIFLESPVFVATTGQLSRPGDYLALDLANVPIMLVRGKDGVVRGFRNTCRHRGATLLEGCGGGLRTIVCPYHAWSYDTAGKLVGVPFKQGFPAVGPDTHSLREIATVEQYGLIFVRVNGEGPLDLNAHLGDELVRQLAPRGWGDWEAVNGPSVDVAANWKLTMDTFGECYHCSVLHKDTLPGLAPNVTAIDYLGPRIRLVFADRSLKKLADIPQDQWRPEKIISKLSVVYLVMPNLVLATHGEGGVQVMSVRPGATVGTSTAHQVQLFSPALSANARSAVEVGMKAFWEHVVCSQDFPLIEGIWRSLTSGSQGEMTFGRNEAALQHLHQSWEDLGAVTATPSAR